MSDVFLYARMGHKYGQVELLKLATDGVTLNSGTCVVNFGNDG